MIRIVAVQFSRYFLEHVLVAIEPADPGPAAFHPSKFSFIPRKYKNCEDLRPRLSPATLGGRGGNFRALLLVLHEPWDSTYLRYIAFKD